MNPNKENDFRYDYVYQTTIYQTYKMGVVKQIHIKNRTYYCNNDIIDLKKFDTGLLKIDKKSYKNIGYITKKKIDDYKKIYSVNPLYLLISNANGYIKGKGVNKYLVFDSTNKNKE